jgi:hypothetical protein
MSRLQFLTTSRFDDEKRLGSFSFRLFKRLSAHLAKMIEGVLYSR